MSSALARKSKLLSVMKPVLDELPSFGTIVDIGCGVGGPAKYLAGYYERYIGIDYSKELIKAAKIFNRNNLNAEFIAESIKSKDLPRQVADVILSDGALHHMTELELVMESLVGIAKPGAFFVAIEPQNGNPLINGLRWIRGFLDSSYSREQIFFSKENLKNLFLTAGITNLSTYYQGFVSTPFAEVVMRPQALFIPLSHLASSMDRWLGVNMPAIMKKISFNIVVIGRFPR